jgi:hypothetical protein
MTVLRGGWDKYFIQLRSSNFTEKRKIAYCIHAVREVDMSTASFLSYLVVQKGNRGGKKSRNEWERFGTKDIKQKRETQLHSCYSVPVPTPRKPHREQRSLSILGFARFSTCKKTTS